MAGTCDAFTKSSLFLAVTGEPIPGPRCRNAALAGQRYCTVHDQRPPDFDRLFRRGAGDLMRCLRAWEGGVWQPTTTETVLLSFLTQAMLERPQQS